MSLSDRKTAIGVGIGALVALGVLGAAVYWLVDDGDQQPGVPIEESAPISAPDSWGELEADRTITVETGDPLRWADDATVMEGPTMSGFDLEWTTTGVDDWRVLEGRADSDSTSLLIRVWTTANLPTVVIDVDAVIQPDALQQELTVETAIHPELRELVDASLRTHSADDVADDAQLLAGRFRGDGNTVQISSSGAATGRIKEASNPVEIGWNVWPGLQGFDDCEPDSEAPARTVSKRIVVQFGDQPLVAPLPVPAGFRAVASPIFVEPPEQSDNPWQDGRSSDAEDYARRFRALAYGHSDEEDPRFGNGGLLAAGMGGVFAVPNQWWDEPPVPDLRASLSDTEIEVVPAVDSGEFDEIATRIVEPGDCSFVAGSDPDTEPRPVVVRNPDAEPVTDMPVAAPFPPALEAGTIPGERVQVLGRMFDFGRPDGLLHTGSHRVGFVPVVATRNPLVDIASQAILEPDSQGHWTLHEGLTRRLSGFEISPRGEHYAGLGPGRLADHRARHADSVPYWNSDGVLAGTGGGDLHLFALGGGDELEVAAESSGESLLTFRSGEDPPRYTGELEPVAVEFE